MRKDHVQYAIFFICLTLFTLTNYGGVRSPDSEIVFRAAESLVDKGDLHVSKDLEA